MKTFLIAIAVAVVTAIVCVLLFEPNVVTKIEGQLPDSISHLIKRESVVGLWVCNPKDPQRPGPLTYYKFNEDGTAISGQTGFDSHDTQPPMTLWKQTGDKCSIILRNGNQVVNSFMVSDNKLFTADGQPMAVRISAKDLPTEFLRPTRLVSKKGSTVVNPDGSNEIADTDLYAYSLAPEIKSDQDGIKADIDHAIAVNTFVINCDPSDKYAYFYRGFAYCFKGDTGDGMADYDHAIDLYPNSFYTPYIYRGTIKQSKGDLEGAIGDFNHAIEINPQLVTGYVKRGVVRAANGDLEGAMADYNRAIEVNPKYADAYNGVAWLLATAPDSSMRNGEKAVEYARKGCDLSEWHNLNIIDTLAAAYAENGDFDLAVKYEQQVLNTPKLSEKGTVEANMHLSFYQSQKPYHQDK